ncbi:hypothetical protein ACFQ0X_19350 [Streptomyces rectiviolaceus]|uniref:Uncharacterized protein n=1 Tax=Streptomyces rectiviolaceus TaxID=332591 RepID=A0ABP6M7T4_9ACTN
MNLTDHPTAWDHPPTRRAWFQHMAMNAVGLVGWIGGWIALLGISTNTPDWVVWIFMPYFLYAPHRVYLQLKGYFPAAVRMQRVLSQYPWQVLADVPRGLGKHPEAPEDGMWFELLNPESPAEKIPLVFLAHGRQHWWMRRIGGPRTDPRLKAEIEPIWFAGDPRFLAVVAAPGRNAKAPKRLHLLYQRTAFNRRTDNAGWDASPAALERARRAGARLPDPVPHPRDARHRDNEQADQSKT